MIKGIPVKLLAFLKFAFDPFGVKLYFLDGCYTFNPFWVGGSYKTQVDSIEEGTTGKVTTKGRQANGMTAFHPNIGIQNHIQNPHLRSSP